MYDTTLSTFVRILKKGVHTVNDTMDKARRLTRAATPVWHTLPDGVSCAGAHMT
jgi:hypothetical protein